MFSAHSVHIACAKIFESITIVILHVANPHTAGTRNPRKNQQMDRNLYKGAIFTGFTVKKGSLNVCASLKGKLSL